jgi:hypothetical protein
MGTRTTAYAGGETRTRTGIALRCLSQGPAFSRLFSCAQWRPLIVMFSLQKRPNWACFCSLVFACNQPHSGVSVHGRTAIGRQRALRCFGRLCGSASPGPYSLVGDLLVMSMPSAGSHGHGGHFGASRCATPVRARAPGRRALPPSGGFPIVGQCSGAENTSPIAQPRPRIPRLTSPWR